MLIGLLLAACAPDCPTDLAAVDYTADDAWICRPGRTDACSEPMQTWDVSQTPPVREDSVPATDPPVDCFYVYPTVDLRPRVALHENLDDLDDPKGVTRMQAARLHESCRVYAPAYRQVTLGNYDKPELGGQCFEDAYADVAAAFEQYLAESGGRPFVLVGHSQGGQIVARLVRERVETDPALLDRLVVALPIGWPIRTARDALVGGSFQTVPVCTSDDQIGCALTYGSYLAGQRVPTELPPYEPGQAMACVNPADVADGASVAALSAAVFPTDLGVVTVPLGIPTGDDVWVVWHDEMASRCVTDGDTAWLEVGWTGDSANPVIPSHWLTGRDGSHILDVQFGLGDLVRTVAVRAQAWQDAHPPAR